jgi:protein-S-isoprenylcysteine O-methyltransferase Ste14
MNFAFCDSKQNKKINQINYNQNMKKKIMPPTYFFILLFLSIALHFLFPVIKIIYPPYTYLGFALIAFGAIINIWSDFLLKKNKTTVRPDEKPSQLVTSGPFSITRNPQYLGFTAILLGVAVLHGTLIMFAFPAFFVIIIEIIFIPMEEKNLESIFGDEYIAYKKRTRRWI